MAKTQIKATAQLFLDVSDAKKDASKFVEDLKQKLSSIETAADKMTVFKDLVGYIGQVDRALAALKAKNGDAFKHMFDGMDANFRKEFESLFGLSGESLSKLDVLREKLATLTPQSSIKDVRKFAQDLHTLYASVGKTPDFQVEDFVGRTNAAYIRKLSDEFNKFGAVWEDVADKVRQGFNFGGGTGGGSGDIGKSIEDIQTEIDKLQSNVDKYKDLKKQLQHLADEKIKFDDGNPLSDEFASEKSVKTIKELVNLFKDLDKARKGMMQHGDTSSVEYYENLAKMTDVSLKIQKLDSSLSRKSVEKLESVNIGKTNLMNLWENVTGDSMTFLDNVTDELNGIPNIIGDVVDKTEAKMVELRRVMQSGGMTSVSSSSTSSSEKAKEAAEYDVLNAKLAEYYELKKKLKTVEKSSDEYKSISDRRRSISNEILNMKELSEDAEESMYSIFDSIDDEDTAFSNALTNICQVLQIEIPRGIDSASNAATAGFAKITQGANNTSNAIQKVMYHIGNLLNGAGKPQDTFDEMPYNLTDAAFDDSKYKQYGYGVFGGGLFGVSDPSTIDPKTAKGGKLLHSIDLSRYNMYMADTEERATNLIDFLSKFQKYALKSAEPNYTGFDEQLNGINIDTLYNQFKTVFSESDLTKEKLNEFLNEMVDLLRQAGLKFDAESESLDFMSIGSLEGSDNISTRLMKRLGYHGVNVGGTSFDGMGQGSVLFDFNESDIVGYFNTVEQAIDDFQNRLNDGSWDGSNEQLKQYRDNIDAIIQRLNEYKTRFTGVDNDAARNSLEQAEHTIQRLSQAQLNIDNILSGQGTGESETLNHITTSLEKTGNAAQEATAKLKAFYDLSDEAKSKHFGSSIDNVEIGKYVERLDMAKAELEELGKQGLIAADELAAVQGVYDDIKLHLGDQVRSYTGYGDGSYYYSYQNEYERAESENESLREENENLRQQLTQNEAQYVDDDADDLARENGQLEEKRDLLLAIANAYGNTITQKERNRYEELNQKDMNDGLTDVQYERMSELGEQIDEADESLERFGETYEKIILQLSNGKKVDILPDDAGLRKLYKIADESYGDEYDGHEIDDIIFVRKQEQEIVEQINQELLEQAQIQKQIATEADADDTVTHGGVTQEAAQYQELLSVIENVKAAVDEKTSAFQNEASVVDAVVEQEIGALNKLKETLESIQTLVQNIFNGQAFTVNGLETAEGLYGESTISATLQSIHSTLGSIYGVLQGFTGIKAENENSAQYKKPVDTTRAMEKTIRDKAAQYSDIQHFVRDNIKELMSFGIKNNEAATNLWRDANYNREDLHPVAMAMDDVADVIRNKVPANILDGWFRNADSNYKSRLEHLALSDTDIRNAALNVMWDNYKNYSGKDIGFDEFLHSNIPVYRGKNSEKYTDGDEVLSFTFDRSVAEKFGKHVFETMIRPIDTIGSYQTTAEGEVLVRRDQLEQLPEFNTWLNNMSSGMEKSFVQTANQVVKQANVDEVERVDNSYALESTLQSVNGVLESILGAINALNDSETRDVPHKDVAEETKKESATKQQSGIVPVQDVQATKNEADAIRQEAAAREQNAAAIKEETTAKERQAAAAKEAAQQDDTVEQPKKKSTRKKWTAEKLAEKKLQLGALNAYQKQLDEAFNPKILKFTSKDQGLNAEQQEIADIYNDATLQIAEYVEAVRAGGRVELSSIQNVIAALRDKVKLYKEQNGLNDSGKQKKNATYGSNIMVNRMAQRNKLQSSLSDNAQLGDSAILQAQLSEYEASWNRLQTLYSKLQGMPNPTEDDKAAFKEASAECSKLGKEVEKLLNTYQKMHSDPNVAGGTVLENYDNRAQELRDYVEATYGAQAHIDGFKNNYNELIFTIDNGNGTFTQAKAAVDNLRTSIIETNGDTEKSTSKLGKFFGDIGSKFKGLWVYATARFGIDEIIQQVRQGLQYVLQIDTALTELKKVTNETDATYAQFLQTMSKTASTVGGTVADLTTMAAEWARLNI